jgi:DNA-damage-inducible protein J
MDYADFNGYCKKHVLFWIFFKLLLPFGRYLSYSICIDNRNTIVRQMHYIYYIWTIGDEEMPRTEVVQARMDAQTKAQAVQVFNELNISTSQAITVFFRQVALQRGIPFDLKIPNKVTAETVAKVRRGEELIRVSGIDELRGEIEG